MSEPSNTIPCAICGKPGQARFAPFCSKRCADIDLGRWLKGSYAIPGPPSEEQGGDKGEPSKPDEQEI